MELLIGIGTFLFILTLILGGYAFLENFRNPKKREVLRRLHTLSSTEYYEDEDIDIMRRELYSTLPWLNELLQSFRWTDRMGRLIEQSGIQTTLGAFVLLSSVVGLIGFLMSSWVTSNRLFSLQPAHLSMPGVHRVAALLKRWLLGTHQGAVRYEQLDYYLDEFSFRFNRRTSRSRGLLFYRLLEQAVDAQPVTYRGIAARKA